MGKAERPAPPGVEGEAERRAAARRRRRSAPGSPCPTVRLAWRSPASKKSAATSSTVTTPKASSSVERGRAERQPEAEQRAGDDDPAGRVGERHRVERGPVDDAERPGVEAEELAVDADGARRAGREHRDGRDREDASGSSLLAQRLLDAPLPALRRGRSPGRTRSAGRRTGRGRASPGRRARRTGAAVRAGSARQRARGRVHGGEHQRVRERLGGDERGVEQVGDEHA